MRPFDLVSEVDAHEAIYVPNHQHFVKDSKLKVQVNIQSERLRAASKQRNDLREVGPWLRKSQVGMPLQFNNLRE